MRIKGPGRWIMAVALGGSLGPGAKAQDTPRADSDRSAMEGLRAPEVAARREAANRVRLADSDVRRAALPVLIDLLMKEKDGQVRLAVLDAVTSLGPEAEPAVPALVHTLRTNYGGLNQEESHQDYRSALALAAIGRPAVEGLRGVLKERKESVRAEAAMALGRIGAGADAAVPDLVPLLGEASERLRREAARSLGLIGPAAVDALIVASVDPKVVVRAAAVEALGISRSADGRATGSVVRAARDDAPEVRAAAVKALARLPIADEALASIALDNLRQDDERVRSAVVTLLAGRRALMIRLVPEIDGLLTSRSDGVARHAAFLLGEVGPDAAPRLLDALGRPESRIEPIAAALARIGRPAVARLDRAVISPDPRVRRGAALALGQIRPLAPGTAKTLAAGLADPDPEVRRAFLAAIGSLGPRAAESADAVRAALGDSSPEIRALAIEVLFQAAPRDERMLGDLSARLDDPEALVQRRAIDALRSLGPTGRKALVAVIDRLGSPDPEVRLAAAQMVESHGPAAVAAIPQLASLLKDPSPKVRTLAATTLGKFGKAAQPAFAPLAELVGDQDVATREAAASALAGLELDAETVRPPLARALRDEKAEVRRAASRAVTRLGPSGAILVPDIIEMAARKENARTVDRLLRPFERGGPDARSIPELARLLDNDQVAVRLLAIKFLGLAGRNARDVLPALERSRDDPGATAEVREQARAACEQIRKDQSPPG